MHLGGTSAFFIAWLANFKLLMFAFGNGPLSDPSLSLPRFLAIACLPIKIQQNPPPNSQKPQNKHNPNAPSKACKKGQKSILNYATKGLLIALLLRVYDYSDYIHSKIILVLFSFHLYFGLEISLAISAALARILLGFELEPQFDEPYLSSSLQDFWGRRWNMMVSRILRPSVYDPTLIFSTRILGRKWAPLPAVISTFLVSAVMHELIFYYLGRVRPTLEITWFFVLHGVCLVIEIAIKKAVNGRCRLPRIITTPLTVLFMMVTGFWLFFPPLLRCKADVRGLEEYAAVGAFLKYVAKIVPKGAIRLMTFVPVVYLFLVLPLSLHSMHLGGTSAFFIAWLANFKLLMFAFGNGPLSDPSLSLPSFLAIACLPIKIQKYPPPNSQKPQNKDNPNAPPRTSKKGHKSLLNYATKGLLIALLVRAYDYIHSKIILVLFSFHMYFGLEIILALSAALARAFLGFELEPQFDEPYLSTSLQDFWGRRWNMMVSRILRPSVYDPTLRFSTRIFGRKWAPLPAVFSTFLVSALMHELILYYLGRVRPTFEITWFFLLHGVCLMIEIAIKKALKGRCRLPRIISTPATVLLVMITGSWLFFPPLLRCKVDVRALDEYAALGAFFKDVSQSLTFKSFNATRVMYGSFKSVV
ncbi:hypothetical protein F0562_018799 [Nyssa sinensis]|uniref:Wax synthase domain-containing protein n=1 Tax=Nyssa sinensis TaxID=561372 RepID=A0A5J4ZB14_9ASTE|nr:hypothetical protein F0562_018799 [Nyssa sinensis]